MGTPIILFGAGASYGSDAEGTPPLGSSLFDALAEFNQETWGQVSSPEATAFKHDFERGMSAYAESHATDGTVDRLQRVMAAYFFNFRPRTTSLYLKLATWLRQTSWNGALASLNYERLLELSLRGVGLNVIVGGPSANSTELCLPHGCCHLFINLRLQGQIVLGSMDLKMESPEPPVPIEDPYEFHQRIRTDNLPPVMCYFEPGKDARCGRRFINGQRARFAALVGAASVVAIVGVKVRPDDRHLWDPLALAPGRLVYCAGNTGAMEFKSWARSCGRNDDCVIPAFWGDAFDEICRALMP